MVDNEYLARPLPSHYAMDGRPTLLYKMMQFHIISEVGARYPQIAAKWRYKTHEFQYRDMCWWAHDQNTLRLHLDETNPETPATNENGANPIHR